MNEMVAVKDAEYVALAVGDIVAVMLSDAPRVCE